MTIDVDENEDDGAEGHTRYPVMPSLVALQQMRNRLHLAFLGKKLMKWSAVATGKELRRLSLELTETYKGYSDNVSEAFLQLARARYFHPRLNTTVLENVGTKAALVVELTSRSVIGVKIFQMDVIDNGADPYQHLGIEKGGNAITEAKIKWRQLIKGMVLMLQQKTGFELLDGANKNATKKQNVLHKLVIPKIQKSLIYIMSELEEQEREETFRLKRFKGSKMKKADQEKAAKKVLTEKVKIDLDILPEIVMTLPVEKKSKELLDERKEVENIGEPVEKEELEIKEEPVKKEELEVIPEPDIKDFVLKEIEDVCTCCHSIAELDKAEFICPICKLLNEARDTCTEITINIVPCKTCLPEVTNNKEYFEHLMAHVNQVIKMTRQYEINSISLTEIQENINNFSIKQENERSPYPSTKIKHLTGLFLPKDKVIAATSVCTCLIEEQEKAACPCENLNKSESCLCPFQEVIDTSSRPTPNPSQESCSCPTPQPSPNHLSHNASYLAEEINNTAFCVNQVITSDSDYQSVSRLRAMPIDSSKTFQAPCCLAHCILGTNEYALRLTKASDLYLKSFSQANSGLTFLKGLGQRIASASIPYFQSGAPQRHALEEVSGFETTTTQLPHSNCFSTFVALTPQFHSIFAQHIRKQNSSSCNTVTETSSLLSSETCSCDISQFAASLSSILGINKSNYRIDYILYTREKSPEIRGNVKSATQTISSNTLTSAKFFGSQNSRSNSDNTLILKPNCLHEMTDVDGLSYAVSEELEHSSTYENYSTNINHLAHTYITMFQQQNTLAEQEDQNGFNSIILFLSPLSPYTREGQPGPCGLTNNSVRKSYPSNTQFTREALPGPCGIIISNNDNICDGKPETSCTRQGQPSPCGLEKCKKASNVVHQQLGICPTRSCQQQTYDEPYTREGKSGPCGLVSSSKPQYSIPNHSLKEMSPASSVKYQSTDVLTDNSTNDTNTIFEQFPAIRLPKLQSVLVHYIINQSQLKAGIDKASAVYLSPKRCRKTQGTLDYDQILTETQDKIKKASRPYISQTQHETELDCMVTKMLADVAKASASYTKCAASISRASDFIVPQSTSLESCTPENCCTSSMAENSHTDQGCNYIAVHVPKNMPCSLCESDKSPTIPCCTNAVNEKAPTPQTASISSTISRKSTSSKKDLALGYFETEYEEITKITRYKDLSGALIDQKQVITIKTEKKYPQKPCCTDTHKMPICVDHCQEFNSHGPDKTVNIPDRKTCRVAKSDIVQKNKDIAPCPKIRSCLSNNDKICDFSNARKPDPLKRQISSKHSCKSSNSGQSNRSDYSYIVDECDCSTSMSNNTLTIPQIGKIKENIKSQHFNETTSCITCNPSTCPKLKDCAIISRNAETNNDANNSLNAKDNNSRVTIKIISKSNDDSRQKAEDEIVLTNSAIDLLRKFLLSSKFHGNDSCDVSHISGTSESVNGTCSLCTSSHDQQHSKDRNYCTNFGSKDTFGISRTSRSIHCQRHCQSNKSLNNNKPNCCLVKNNNDSTKTEQQDSERIKNNKDVGTSTRLKDKYDVRPIYKPKNQNNNEKVNSLTCKCHSDDRVYGKSRSSNSLHTRASSSYCCGFHR